MTESFMLTGQCKGRTHMNFATNFADGHVEVGFIKMLTDHWKITYFPPPHSETELYKGYSLLRTAIKQVHCTIM